MHLVWLIAFASGHCIKYTTGFKAITCNLVTFHKHAGVLNAGSIPLECKMDTLGS